MTGRTEMNRRKFLRLLSVGALSSALPLVSCASLSKPNPNILLIIVDSLNDWVGCLGGHPDTQTPNIDLLAQRGILFSNAHCAAPNNNASRASLFTGLYPTGSGVYTGYQDYRIRLPHVLNLPQLFGIARYNTFGLGRVFRRSDLTNWQRLIQAEDIPRPEHKLNGIPGFPNFDWGPLEARVQQTQDFQLTRRAMRLLQDRHSRPFFIGIGLSSARLPWYLPQEQFHHFSPDAVHLPQIHIPEDLPPEAQRLLQDSVLHELVLQHQQWEVAVAAYLSCIHFVDQLVGELIGALDESNYSSNTIIVLCSSQGFHLGEKRHWTSDRLWEPATHVPLIFVLPEMASRGAKCDRSVSLIDIFPTLIDIAGIRSNIELDGNSLSPLMQDPQREWNRPVLIAQSPNTIAARSNEWRYIRHPEGGEELYNYSENDWEAINFANEAQFQPVKDQLAQYFPDQSSQPVPTSTPNPTTLLEEDE